MAENAQTQPCPSCGATIAIGSSSCPACGVNIITGETYGSMVERARGTAVHPEFYRRGIYLGITVLFAIVVGIGALYQRQTTWVLRRRPEFFMHPYTALGGEQPMHCFRILHEIDALALAGDETKAGVLADELIKVSQGHVDKIEVQLRRFREARAKPERGERAELSTSRRVLNSVIKKAEFKRMQIGS